MTEFAASVMIWGRLATVADHRQVRAFKGGLTSPEILFVFAHPLVAGANVESGGVTMGIIMDVATVYQNLYSSSAAGLLEAQRATQRGVLLTSSSAIEDDTSSLLDHGENGEGQGLLAIQRTTDRWAPPAKGGGTPGSTVAGSVVAPSSVGPSASVAPGMAMGADALARQFQEMAVSQRQFQELMEQRWQEMQTRSLSRRGCYHCGQTNHMSGQCPQRGDRWGPGACNNCGVGGHIAVACPQPRRQGPLIRCAWFTPPASNIGPVVGPR